MTARRPPHPGPDLIEDIEWCLETGETHPEAIARRLDMTAAAISRSLRRNGRPDLACLFDQARAATRIDTRPHHRKEAA